MGMNFADMERAASHEEASKGREVQPPPGTDSPSGLSRKKLLWVLQETRRELAQELGVRAPTIMNKKTMAAVVNAAPTTIAELKEIPGIGAWRLEHAGPRILDAIRRFRDGSLTPIDLSAPHPDHRQNRLLFDRLREWRGSLGVVAPRSVLSDKDLHEISQRRPGSPAELANILSIRAPVASRYGEAMLAIVAEFPSPRCAGCRAYLLSIASAPGTSSWVCDRCGKFSIREGEPEP